MSGESSQGGQSPANSDLEEKHCLVTPDGGAPFHTGLIKDPTDSDVLCGRGGSINSHVGNERFRLLVEKRKRVYLTARFKREKRLIASSIVAEIHELIPKGRFLTRDSKSGSWRDIGDEKARDKTSQALRENAPSIRAEIETEINEQRAEMQRAEEDEVARSTSAPPHPYYNAGWGYHSSYYGYSHHAPPPPPPHGHPSHPPHPPPPPGHPGYHNGPYGQWGGPPPPPPPYPGYDPHSHPHSHYPPHPPPHRPEHEKSTLEKTADLVSSGAESIKNWTIFGGINSTSSDGGQDSRSVASGKSKPIAYVHQPPDGKKRRVVKFQEDHHRGAARRRFSNSHMKPSSASVHSSNSLLDALETDIEPHSLEASDVQNDSLMNQVANQILVNFGSWDTSAFCGNDVSDEVPFPKSQGGPSAVPEEEMTIEWEGQEVQLQNKNLTADYNSVGSDERMPPPVVRRRPVPDQTASVGFSSLGSCNSWLPEAFPTAASIFGGSASMDMDFSAAGGGSTGGHTEQFSTNGSLGGGSLTRVFENEILPDDMPSVMTPTNMSHRQLSQIPSWERSVRGQSPLSVGSEDDDESLVSKTSDKGSVASSLSGLRGATASPTHMDADDMNWESRE
jgi:hypothetical protein